MNVCISVTVARVPVPKSLISLDGVPSEKLIVSKEEYNITFVQIVKANTNKCGKNPLIESQRDHEPYLEDSISILKECRNNAFFVDNICTTKDINMSESRLGVQAAKDLTSISLLDCNFDCINTNNDYSLLIKTKRIT